MYVYVLVIFILSPLNILTSGKKFINFIGKFSASTTLANVDQNKFQKWFRNKNIQFIIFKLNDGLERIEQNSNTNFRLYLKPMKFPGCSVHTTCDCDVNFENDCIDILIKEGNLKQVFKGIFSSLFSTVIPKVESRSTFIYDKQNKNLINKAFTKISFSVPSWLPVSAKYTERYGTKVIQKTMERDLNGILNKVIIQYNNSLLNEESNKLFFPFKLNHYSKDFQNLFKEAKERILYSFNSEKERFIF